MDYSEIGEIQYSTIRIITESNTVATEAQRIEWIDRPCLKNRRKKEGEGETGQSIWEYSALM